MSARTQDHAHARALPQDDLAQLRRFDSCAIANAVESTGIHLRNEGYVDSSVRCLFPEMEPLVAYALPLRIRAADPPTPNPHRGRPISERTDWWEELLVVPAPRVLVVEDVDAHPGTGAFFGEVHANIFKSLGCVGVITNGAVRDLPAVQALGFNVFAANPSVSHAYAHVIDVGRPVRIGGLTVNAGDILHGDRHGILSIPRQIAGDLPRIAAQMRTEELAIIEYCHSPQFSIEGLRQLLRIDRG